MSAANSIQPQAAPRTQAADTQGDFWLLSLQFLTVSAVIAATIALGVYLTQALQWRSQTFPGFNTAYTMVVDGNTSFGGGEWAGLDAGLQRLDRITTINGVELPQDDYTAARQQFREVASSLNYGNVISLRFTRPVAADGTITTSGTVNCQAPVDGFAACRVAYNLTPMPASDFLTYFVLPYLSGLFMLVIAVGLVFLRSNQPNALLIAIFSATLAVFSAGVFNNSTTYAMIPVWLAATAAGAAAAYLIALVFPTRPALLYRNPWLVSVPVLFFIGVAVYDIYLFLNLPTPYDFAMVWQMPVGLAMLSFLTLIGSLLVRRRYAISNIYRDQINTSLAGVGVAAIPVILWVMSTIAVLVGNDVPLPFNSATVMPFFIAIPMSLSYAVLQYRGFDADQILSKGIGYMIMLLALVMGYAVLVFGINMLTLEIMPQDLATNPFIVGIVIFVIAVAFLPVRTRLQGQIDRIYFRERREYQDEIEAFTSEVAKSQNFVEILRLYVDRVKDVVGTRGVFIFLPDEETGEYVAQSASNPSTDIGFGAKCDMLDLLSREPHPIRVRNTDVWYPELIPERTRLNILKANLIIALRSGSQTAINGFVVISDAQAQRETYDYEEIRFLDNITRQMAISVERAKVVESLERRVNELDVLGQVSQAVNFAIEFDDLLELISAQTQRLIEAEHFYIALRDPSTNQMYYAFFLEFNERLRERENQRWNMGNDLFARILENVQPERHDDYDTVVRIANLNSRGIDNEVNAWMGVPLIAGQTHLGVMAAGTSQQGFTYTDDHLKVFRDIGALAATSLDKARLYEETNERARQLRALNDISRQLQAERDIERLLNLVTSSAVDILGAEAGSLLLEVEGETAGNNKKDLEFRVVVGGSGEDLIGQRVKAGHGLVGEVAESGKPVIVNNTSEDNRWGGEVSGDANFNTNAVLAVPLMANNQVIGVLEVLNKKDGSLYVKEDADVLETFAGQAAIAIENVRLFQKTDEQLSARVQELETLERIDTELNRALDMKRVSEITIKWAVANTGAAAGLLGLVHHDQPPMLEILARYGYTDEDHPEGAEGDLWPLDRGIVKRVLRTKRADIQPDTAIDPDYVPSLVGATSQITVPMLAGGEIIALLILEKNTNPRLSLLDLAFVQRLTDHAAIALENARLYSELSQANKVQSDMMGVGAHELKNALAPIRGFADMVKVFGEINDQQANSLEVIKRNTDRAQVIIQDLRDFARMRANELSVNPEPISFSNIVVETLRPFIAQIEDKEQTLNNNILTKEELPLVMGDSTRLIQVMTNFVSNAYKYSPSGATITLDAEVHQKDNTDYLLISIADTGLGISKEDQRQMFQPYFRSTNEEAKEKPGTGLGMYLTREIIRQHGGDVWLESELGEGTTFYFTVPLAPEEEPASEPASD